MKNVPSYGKSVIVSNLVNTITLNLNENRILNILKLVVAIHFRTRFTE